MFNVIAEISRLSVLFAFVPYFLLGALWFTLLFSKQYKISLGIENDAPQKPAPIFITGPALCCFVITIASAILIYALRIDSYQDAVIFAVIIEIGYLVANTVNIAINPNIPRPLLYGLISNAAMNKLRAAMRHTDRDHLEALAPNIQVREPVSQHINSNAYQQLVTAVTAHRVVQLSYKGADSDSPVNRDVEPIGLYLSQQWHVVAYCRLWRAFRDFRLDRIQHLAISEEIFASRPKTLQQYWIDEAKRRSREKVDIRFQATAILPALAQHLQNTKHQYGAGHTRNQCLKAASKCCFLLDRFLTSQPGYCLLPAPSQYSSRTDCASA